MFSATFYCSIAVSMGFLLRFCAQTQSLRYSEVNDTISLQWYVVPQDSFSSDIALRPSGIL